MILLEILQGVREREDRERIELDFEPFLLLATKRSTIRLAAGIYQDLQRKGIRIRSSIDCLIAATAIEAGASVLHKGRDFDFIARHYPLVTVGQ
jgi:predicted nucleic acid-binding protein